MRERLPGITLRPRIEPKLFFDRLYELAQGQNTWAVRRFQKDFESEGNLLLSFAHKATTGEIPKDLIAQFIHMPKYDKDKVRIEMRASNWGEPAPTYNSYVATAKLLNPLLGAYNRQYNTRLRLLTQSQKALVPRLSPQTRFFFDLFVNAANKSGLHPYDWGRFYDFILVSHMFRMKLTEDDVACLLALAGFDYDYAGDIASVYGHGRAILRRPRNPILAREWQEIRACRFIDDRQ